jgi:hypothetical protein
MVSVTVYVQRGGGDISVRGPDGPVICGGFGQVIVHGIFISQAHNPSDMGTRLDLAPMKKGAALFGSSPLVSA